MDDEQGSEKEKKFICNLSMQERTEGTEENPKELDIDEMLDLIGQFGKIQILWNFLLCAMMLPAVYQIFIMNFTANNPPWKCSRKSKECNLTREYTAGQKYYNHRCNMKNDSWDFVKPSHYSIVTEWHLICDKEIYSYMANSGSFIGWAVGGVLLGVVSDKFGRKIVLFPSLAVILIAGLITTFTTTFWEFFILRIIIGFCQGGVILTIFVMATEVVAPKYRSLSGTLIWFAFTLALCLTALQAWLLQNWRRLSFILTAPYLFIICFYKCLPESLRWYKVNNRTEEAEMLLKRIARVNGKPWPKAKLKTDSCEVKSDNFFSLFYPKKMFVSTSLQCIAWYANGLVYFGLSIASNNLGGNIYRDFVLTSIVEVPANIMVVVGTDRLGRKPTTIFSMILGALSCLVLSGISKRAVHRALKVAFGMIGKLLITLSFNSFYVWSVELFPTSVRSQGMGLVSVCSRIGAASAPWIADWLSLYDLSLPFTVMGSISLISAMSLFWLDETRGRSIPDTVSGG